MKPVGCSTGEKDIARKQSASAMRSGASQPPQQRDIWRRGLVQRHFEAKKPSDSDTSGAKRLTMADGQPAALRTAGSSPMRKVESAPTPRADSRSTLRIGEVDVLKIVIFRPASEIFMENSS